MTEPKAVRNAYFKLEAEILNPLEHSGWDDQLLSLNGSSFFHTSAWARVLCEAYQYSPLYFSLSVNDTVQAVIPVMEVNSALTGRRGVSLTFTDYCEPAVQAQEQFDCLFDSIVAHGKKSGWQSIELRGAQAYLPAGSASASYLVHELDLPEDEAALHARFRNSTKRNIKKAISEGVEVEICNSAFSMEEFQRLNCITRKKHGLPPQPESFFDKIYEHVISKDKGFIVLAKYQEKYIAAAVYFHFHKKALYKYGASDETYQHLRANNLVMWEAIKWCCRNGYKTFCFGRTDPGNEGLRQFKNGWDTKESTIHYHRYDLRTDTFVSADIELNPSYTKLMEKLPVPVLKVIGSLLYRHKG